MASSLNVSLWEVVTAEAVVRDVQAAVAACVATLLAAALWFVIRVSLDIDLGRPRTALAAKAVPVLAARTAAPAQTPAAPAPTPAPTANGHSAPPAKRPVESAPAPESRPPTAVPTPVPTLRKAPPQFVDLIERSKAEILGRITETKWTFMTGEDNIDIYCLPDPPKPDRYKAVILVKAPAEVVMRAMYDLKLRSNWDKGMTGDRNRTIVYFDKSISITYYRVGAIGTVSSRDFLDLRSLYQLEGNQGFLVVFHSVEWDQQPLVPNVMRAHNHPTAQLIRRLPDNSCEVTNFVQCDLRGWLPTRLIRLSIGSSMISMFKSLRAYCEKEASNLFMEAAEIERYTAESARG